jgi:hypothetical protein
MKRTVYAIKTKKGYLQDIEKYSNNILEVPVFVDWTEALHKAALVSRRISTECWISQEQLPFPRPTALLELTNHFINHE